MSFGDVIRTGTPPENVPSGDGGTPDTCWHSNRGGPADRVYELSVVDFSTIRFASSPETAPEGHGGDDNTIWHCDFYSNRVYELSTVDFSTIRSRASPSTIAYGIGGTASVIWHCDNNLDEVYELSTADLTIIRSTASPSTLPTGIGGDGDYIWYCDHDTVKTYDLDPSDFSVRRSANCPSTAPYGIGGDTHVIWHSSRVTASGEFYELDPESIVLPTVSTDAVSGITINGAEGNGSIDDHGGENNDERGFVYGPSSHGDPGNTAPGATDYARYVSEADSFPAGNFSLRLTGLKSGRVYYVRAYSHNSAGYAYGGEVSFRAQVSRPLATALAEVGV